MRCWKARRILVDYMDNELPEEQYLQVREHLDECQKCLTLLKEYRAVSDICGGVRRLNTQKLCEGEADKIWAKVQAGIAIFKKGKPSMKIKISKWLRKHIRIYIPKIKPVNPGIAIVLLLIGGLLYLKAISSHQSIILPTMVTRGIVKVWHEKDTMVFEPELGEEFIIDTSDNQRIRFKTPNAQVEAGSNTQLYLKPEKDKPTTVGVVYAYDSVSLLTKHSRINLSSGTTAYVYPDGRISKPEKISKIQLKKWQDVIEGQSIQKPGKN